MKPITLSILLSILLINSGYGQGLYFRFGGGYGLPLATQSIGSKELRVDTYTPSTNTTTTTTSITNVSASFGSGMSINLGGGYMFNKNIGVDLGIQYQKSKKYETSDIYIDKGNGFSGKEEDVLTYQSSAIFISPSMIITSGMGSKVPYGKFGVIVGSPKIKIAESYYYDLDGIDTENRELELKKGMAFGFQGTVGMNWMLSNKVDLFTEINFVSMSFYPGELRLTVYNRNGIDELATLNTYAKVTEFKKEIDPNTPFDATKPQQALREALQFSSLSLNVGVRFLLKGHND